MQLRNRASVICVHDSQLLTVKLRDPVSHREYFFPPGGGLEPSEKPLTAALRETLEETGYEVDLEPKSETLLDYVFIWAGELFRCQTYFYRGRILTDQQPLPTSDPNVLKVEWLPLRDVEPAFRYHEDLCRTVMRLVEG